MNKRQRKRLLNVAKALRESPAPDRFTMVRFGHSCGTPACALGHYAARTDLQRVFVLNDEGVYFSNVVPFWRGCVVDHDDDFLIDHFGIRLEEATELFDVDGCNNAQTATEAADYIEAFVARETSALGAPNAV